MSIPINQNLLNNLKPREPDPTFFLISNQDACAYVANLDLNVTEDILIELFLQCGPVVAINFPKDKITKEHSGVAFIEFRTEMDCDYACKIMHSVKLFGKPLKVMKATSNKVNTSIGAKLFVGNLSENLNETTLREAFLPIGEPTLVSIARNDDGSSKRYGFVCFDRFEASDLAIKNMNGMLLQGRVIKVEYAYKEGSRTERHGSLTERIAAASRKSVHMEKVDSGIVDEFGMGMGISMGMQQMNQMVQRPINGYLDDLYNGMNTYNTLNNQHSNNLNNNNNIN